MSVDEDDLKEADETIKALEKQIEELKVELSSPHKIIVFVTHSLGGAQAWVNTNKKIDDMIVVIGPDNSMGTEEQVDEATECLDGAYLLDGADVIMQLKKIEERMKYQRDAQKAREAKAELEY